jgi:site-specific DNA-methyltransferase (adenine-specific)
VARTLHLKEKYFWVRNCYGNNKKHLVPATTQLGSSCEPIFTGRELLPCRFVEPRFYISLDPSQLQQVAPIQQYRSPKICYRFISDSVVTVFDQSGSLILNSLNQFTINDPEISPKALSNFLNSEPVTFIYRKLFKSHKLLKHHIESIPIPIAFFENIEK